MVGNNSNNSWLSDTIVEHNGYWISEKQCEITSSTNLYTWELLKTLADKKVFLYANSCNPTAELPPGYNLYLVKNEGPDIDWMYNQVQKVGAPIVLLNVCYNQYHNQSQVNGVHWMPWIEWHYQTDKMMQDHNVHVQKKLKNKISCLTRISKTNKLIALAAVHKYHPNSCLTSYHDKVNYQNADLDTTKTGHPEYDRLLKEIPLYCKDKVILDDLEDFEPDPYLFQTKIHNFHHPAYQTCAINITNESFFDSRNRYFPGPFITEKTLNCLLGETPFISNGQMHTYKTLTDLGFGFDYGIDLSYDNLLGDLDRMVAVHNRIKQLSFVSSHDIHSRSRQSCLENKEHIASGKFFSICEKINEQTVEQIHKLL